MKVKIDEIVVDGRTYVEKESVKAPAQALDGMPYVIIRSARAGVFAGYLKSRNGQEVILLRSRRIFYWSGAASLTQLANDGTNKPNDCKFTQELAEHTILEVIEVNPTTEKARLNIQGIKVWQM